MGLRPCYHQYSGDPADCCLCVAHSHLTQTSHANTDMVCMCGQRRRSQRLLTSSTRRACFARQQPMRSHHHHQAAPWTSKPRSSSPACLSCRTRRRCCTLCLPATHTPELSTGLLGIGVPTLMFWLCVEWMCVASIGVQELSACQRACLCHCMSAV